MINQNFDTVFEFTYCSYLQITKTVCQVKLKILDLSIFSGYGHGARLIFYHGCEKGLFLLTTNCLSGWELLEFKQNDHLINKFSRKKMGIKILKKKWKLHVYPNCHKYDYPLLILNSSVLGVFFSFDWFSYLFVTLLMCFLCSVTGGRELWQLVPVRPKEPGYFVHWTVSLQRHQRILF